MQRLKDRVLTSAADFDPRTMPLALTRSILAVSELISIGFTPDHDLFTYQPGLPEGMRCYGARELSLWCVAGPGSGGLLVSRLLATAVLVLVAIGYRPKWTCVPHWFVAWSLGQSMTMASGAEEAALAATMLIIPFLLGDGRTWHWTRPGEPLAPVWAGSSYAAWWAIRCQIAVIYFTASISKLTTAGWRSGQAMFTVLVDPFYGLPSGLRQPLEPLLTSDPAVRLLTWGVLVVELLIAVGALLPRRVRRTAFCLTVLLHGGIMVAMGLVSFGLVMIALVLLLLVGEPGGPAPVSTSDKLAPASLEFEPPARDAPTEILEIR
ncbi:sporulation-delaying protein SdpB family protein [Streptacidiphilus anmyonensis]|uniref:sporulation-delaying protein SdpB family protein n=1 Tax=Streptacidiphilus anmyonensis TaxID=405782 RepID=UPI000693E55D|nr:sporulation-delaying protein SdpB family protein [Streptacidiphilus anmyonensis]